MEISTRTTVKLDEHETVTVQIGHNTSVTVGHNGSVKVERTAPLPGQAGQGYSIMLPDPYTHPNPVIYGM